MVYDWGMQPGEACLAVSCGSAGTVAVLTGAGGWFPLLFDGGLPWLSSSVFVGPDGAVLTGERAWQAGAGAPERFEVAPLRRVREDRLEMGGSSVEVTDLVAATLGRVGAEAARLAGGPVADVRLVVPAGWGPRRRMWMRQVARRAGLGHPTLVDAPVVAAGHVVNSGVQLPVGSFVVVCDFGGGFEVSVLRRGPAGFEVLSTLADPDAGGLRVDEALADRLVVMAAASAPVPAAAGGAPAGRELGPSVLASARAVKEVLSNRAAVTSVVPPSPTPVVVTSVVLEEAARPVLERAAGLTVEAVAAAELSPDQLAGVYCVGGGAVMPLAARVVAEATGRTPLVVADPGLAGVRGAAGAGGQPARADGAVRPVAAESPTSPLRRVAAMVVPGLASLALVAHFLSTPIAHRRLRSTLSRPVDFGVVVNWGELAMAGVFALVACLCGAALLASVLPTHASARAPSRSDGERMGVGLVAAAALGLAICGLYAVGAALYLYAPTGPFLRWALEPVAPVAAVALVAGAVTVWLGRVPAGGWHGWLGFPVSSVVAAAVGMLLVEYANRAQQWPQGVLLDVTGRVGGLLLGVGAALAVVRPLLYRLVVAAPLAVFTAAVTSVRSTGVLAVIYTTAVAVWWLQRLWRLLSRPGPAQVPGG
jgi:hypothetical protein